MQGVMVRRGMSGASVATAPRDQIEATILAMEPAAAHTGLHWIVFAAPTAMLTLSLLMVLSGMSLEVFGVFTFLYAVGAIASACFNFAFSDFAISNNRLFMKTGFIRRSSVEVQLGAIEGIQVQQGFFGRLLGYGSVIVTGNGGWQHPYHRVSAPSIFCKRVKQIRQLSVSR